MKPEDMKAASFKNRDKINADTRCGCYFCIETFGGGEIEDWVDGGETAICPICDIDSVVPHETDIEALGLGCEMWFTGVVDEEHHMHLPGKSSDD